MAITDKEQAMYPPEESYQRSMEHLAGLRAEVSGDRLARQVRGEQRGKGAFNRLMHVVLSMGGRRGPQPVRECDPC